MPQWQRWRLLNAMNLLRVDFDFGDLASTQTAELLGESLRAEFSFPTGGPKGDKGDTGDVGPAGATGAAGAKGDKGDTGAVGPAGPAGAAGAQGPAGAKGDKGDTGDVGPAGATGAKGDKGDTGDVGPSGASNWNEISGKPASFSPSQHASTHHTGGTDAIAPSSIGAQSIFTTTTLNLSANTTLTAARATNYSVINSGNYTITLPTTGHLVGDIVVVRYASGTGTLNVTWGAGGQSVALNAQYRFIATGTGATNWALVNVDTHTHPASAISDSTTAGRALLTGADAEAQRTSLGLGGWAALSDGATLRTEFLTISDGESSDYIQLTAGMGVVFNGNRASQFRTALGLGTAATSSTGDFAAASHTHGNLSSTGTLGSTSGLPVVTTTSGAITTLALGAANTVLKVNSGGTGVEFGEGGGVDDYTVITSSQTATNGARIAANTTAGAFTLTLPASPANGDTIYVLDYAGTFDTNNLTLGRNGSNIESLAENMDCNIEDAAFSLVYVGSTVGWKVVPYFGAKTNLASAGPIGSTIPSTGAFTTLSANNGTLTAASSPVLDLAQTWNNAAVTFVGFRFNATDTASSANSSIAEFQLNGASYLRIQKEKNTGLQCCLDVGATVNASMDFQCGGNRIFRAYGAGAGAQPLYLETNGGLQFSPISPSTSSFRLEAEAANTLAARQGTAGQTFNIYNTFTNASNHERGVMAWVSNVFRVGTERAGSGTNRTLELITDGLARLTISAGGQLTVAAGSQLRFGGSTSSFPALKQSSTVLQARLADDSAFAPLQGQLRIHQNAVSETITATHTLTLYDAAGTAYKVPCVAA